MVARKKAKPPQVRATPVPSKDSLWRKPWPWLFGGIAGLSILLTNINSILSNARALPGEWDKTADHFSSWYHEDAEWNGRWTNNPEGYVDEADMDLSKNDVEIKISAKNGVIDGTIATKSICDHVPFVDFLLLRGKVSGGKTANVVAWDVMGGHDTDFAKLKLVRDGITMKVSFVEGEDRLFPEESKIALDPNMDRNKIFDLPSQQDEFCKGETERTVKGVREPVEHMHRSPGKTPLEPRASQ